MTPTPEPTISVIANLPEHFQLCTDSAARAVLESMERNEHTPIGYQLYDSVFVEVLDGEYGQVWGFHGCVPYLSKLVTRLR